MEEVSACTSGASPETTTASSTPPTSSLKSMRRRSWTRSTTPLRVSFLKPGATTLTEYVPIRSGVAM
jgi:hypothetical protein